MHSPHSYCTPPVHTQLLTHIRIFKQQRAMGAHNVSTNLETKLQTLCFVQLASRHVHVLSYYYQHKQMRLL